jgi:hypothetical protein
MNKSDYYFTVKIPVNFELGCTIAEEEEVKRLIQEGIVMVLNSIKRQEHTKVNDDVWIPELTFGKVLVNMKAND